MTYQTENGSRFIPSQPNNERECPITQNWNRINQIMNRVPSHKTENRTIPFHLASQPNTRLDSGEGRMSVPYQELAAKTPPPPSWCLHGLLTAARREEGGRRGGWWRGGCRPCRPRATRGRVFFPQPWLFAVLDLQGFGLLSPMFIILRNLGVLDDIDLDIIFNDFTLRNTRMSLFSEELKHHLLPIESWSLIPI